MKEYVKNMKFTSLNFSSQFLIFEILLFLSLHNHNYTLYHQLPHKRGKKSSSVTYLDSVVDFLFICGSISTLSQLVNQDIFAKYVYLILVLLGCVVRQEPILGKILMIEVKFTWLTAKLRILRLIVKLVNPSCMSVPTFLQFLLCHCASPIRNICESISFQVRQTPSISHLMRCRPSVARTLIF